MNSILFSPHNDDESLFAAYTLMREKPLVVICTDGYLQGLRGDPITAIQRRKETAEAMKILGCPFNFLGIRDDTLRPQDLENFMLNFHGFDKVYVPAIQGGNWQHDLVGETASRVFGDKAIHYTTYTKTELWTPGRTEIKPTQEEMDLKNKALDCYQSQINLGATAPHFKAVRNKSEWYL